jgi:DNA uptake protein ComE-like DNA-binding protein
VVTGSAELDTVLELAPEWGQLLRSFDHGTASSAAEFLNKVGAKAIYCKALALADKRTQFIQLLQSHYYQPMLTKMLSANQNLRRFLSQRRVAPDDVRGQVISLAVDATQKLVSTLNKHLGSGEEDGFKVLLPAYVQRSVHNAVIDYIRQETSWERHTLQDVNLDPQQEDPRTAVADDSAYTPEHKALSREQVSQLNELRKHLDAMLKDGQTPAEPLTVVDCMFGLGLTPHSVSGEEMTMRECCDKLGIQADTMPRRIARCQVLLDKGLELVRRKIYKDMPGIAEAWQRGLNVNLASRRELAQQLSMTEGEVERCIKYRQYASVDEMIERGVITRARVPELSGKGLVAAFVPVDLNAATTRDIIDIVGMPKEKATQIVAERPFQKLEELVERKMVSSDDLILYMKRGAVVRAKAASAKRVDLNRVSQEEIEALGIKVEDATLIVKTRPFLTWSEVEEFLGPESSSMGVLRQQFFLGLTPG